MSTTQIKDGFNGGSDNQLKVNSDGSINIDQSISPGVPSSNVSIVQGGNTALVSSDGALLTVADVTGTVTTDVAGLSNFQTSQYTVGTSVVQITPTALAHRSSISLRVTATASNSILIGNSSSLTIFNGYPLHDGDTLQMDLTPANSIYAVSTAAGQTLYILEIA